MTRWRTITLFCALLFAAFLLVYRFDVGLTVVALLCAIAVIAFGIVSAGGP
jgi:hypothetical protein